MLLLQDARLQPGHQGRLERGGLQRGGCEPGHQVELRHPALPQGHRRQPWRLPGAPSHADGSRLAKGSSVACQMHGKRRLFAPLLNRPAS